MIWFPYVHVYNNYYNIVNSSKYTKTDSYTVAIHDNTYGKTNKFNFKYSSPCLIRPLLPNAILFIKPDFRCTEIVKYINKLSHRIAFSLQKVWSYKRGQLHYQKLHCL